MADRADCRYLPCGGRIWRPGRSSGMFVLMEDATEAVASSYVQIDDPGGFGDRFGLRLQQRRLFARWGRWTLSCASNPRRTYSRWGRFQTPAPGPAAPVGRSRSSAPSPRSSAASAPPSAQPRSLTGPGPRRTAAGISCHGPGSGSAPPCQRLPIRDQVPRRLHHPAGGGMSRRAQNPDVNRAGIMPPFSV